ncbi:MAG: LPS export ABC transporter permease LptG [Alphaproteobacteria bacterium]|nr:LPS export ABC transporter permease LptG [Alphaproteobacteria bacterium]
MRLSLTLSNYIGRQFMLWFSGVFLAFACILLLFDTLELLRRAASKPDATFAIVFKMALFKLPHMTQLLVPFAVLFGGMLAFWRLTRSHELVVARAAGVSVWQFLLPSLLGALGIGVLKVGLFNPMASVMLVRFTQLESLYLHGQPSALAVSPSGFWLREIRPKGVTLVHGIAVAPADARLNVATVFQFDLNHRFIGRIDAAEAILLDGHWRFRDAWVAGPERPTEHHAQLTVPTLMTWAKIEDSFAPPETLAVWDLYRFIGVLETAGFPALKHRQYFHALLAGPLLLCAMVLIAATFSLRPSRRGGVGYMVIGGVVAGFLFYIMSDFVSALGLSGYIPAVLAAWTPAGVSTLLGIATLFHLEDG